jgi:hypothetical protein
MSVPAPLLDMFRRGEAPRDVRLLAASGAIAPRAHEQMALLMLLSEDADAEVRETAGRTLNALPLEPLKKFLARSDVPIDMREFFADRGVFPDEIPALSADEPLFDTGAEEPFTSPLVQLPAAVPAGGDNAGADRDSIVQQLAKMSFSERLKAAVKGSREVRAILIREPNKMIAAAVLSSPKVTEQEIESFARMANVSEEVLRILAANRTWMKNYGTLVALTKNPKTPVAISLNLLARLNERDVTAVSSDRNVPEALRQAARRKVALGEKR